MKNFKIYIFLFFMTLLISIAHAGPRLHMSNKKFTGWCYPLDDSSNGKPIENISLGFMSYFYEKYHYAQDFTIGYKEGDNVYAMADGEIVQIRKSQDYGGGSPCDSEYNSLLTKHNYYKKDGSLGVLYIFYGHLKNIRFVPEGSTNKFLNKNIPIMRGDKIAELNDPRCSFSTDIHLHLTVMPDDLPTHFYNGYNDDQTKNGRARPFNGPKSKDWVHKNGKQNLPEDDEPFFDTFKAAPYSEIPGIDAIKPSELIQKTVSNGWRIDTFKDHENEMYIWDKGCQGVLSFHGEGDFNGDSQRDMAIGVRNIANPSVSKILVFWGPKFNTLSSIGWSKPFKIIKAGKIRGFEGQLKLKCDGIEMHVCEVSSWIMFWDKGEFNRFQTGD